MSQWFEKFFREFGKCPRKIINVCQTADKSNGPFALSYFRNFVRCRMLNFWGFEKVFYLESFQITIRNIDITSIGHKIPHIIICPSHHNHHKLFPRYSFCPKEAFCPALLCQFPIFLCRFLRLNPLLFSKHNRTANILRFVVCGSWKTASHQLLCPCSFLTKQDASSWIMAILSFLVYLFFPHRGISCCKI
jgi:hypothetical protein